MTHKETSAQLMYDEAMELLSVGEAKKALKIGQKLEKVRYSGGFEVQALAYNALDMKKEAIKVLNEGTDIVPDLWLLWQLLGNYYSDEGKFKDSFASYEEGLKISNHCKISLNYNYALAFEKSGDMLKAQKRLSKNFEDKLFNKEE